MSQEVYDVVLGALRLLLVLVVVPAIPLLFQLILLFWTGRLFFYLVAKSLPRLAGLLELISVPVHELSHAAAVWATGSGVSAIKLLSHDRIPGQVLTKRRGVDNGFLPSVAPLLGGILVLWLTANYILPGFDPPAVPLPRPDAGGGATPGTILIALLAFIEDLGQAVIQTLASLDLSNWRTYLGLFIALSVAFQIAPSEADMAFFRRGVPVVIALVVGAAIIVYLAGDPEQRFLRIQNALLPHLVTLSSIVVVAFAFVLLGVLIFAPVRYWRKRSTNAPQPVRRPAARRRR